MIPYTEIMIRYGELSTKGKNRRYFIQRLKKNVKETLVEFPELEINTLRDRMHILLNGADAMQVMDRLKSVFGIQNFSPVISTEKSLEKVKKTAIDMVKAQFSEGMSFKIAARRSDHEFVMDTTELNHFLGDAVVEAIPEIEVKMKRPDIELRVEIRQDGAYLSSETIKGAGGLPVGTAGKGMLMLSGGIDSPVAGYLAMKRGLRIEAVHFASPPYTSEQSLQKTKDLAVKLTRFGGNIQFIEVPFSEIQEEIKQKVPEGYLMTVTRRMMMRLVDEIRKQRDGLVIVNGESIGQVASQTLHSMVVINDVTTTPVIRPVVTMDKNEIIDIAQEIDTFELAIQPFEDCCTIFAPPQPKTRPKLEKAIAYEAKLDINGLIQRAIEGIEITEITPEQKYLTSDSDEFSDLL